MLFINGWKYNVCLYHLQVIQHPHLGLDGVSMDNYIAGKQLNK